MVMSRGHSLLFSEKKGHAQSLKFRDVEFKVQNSHTDFNQEERVVYGGAVREMLTLDFNSKPLLAFYQACLENLITGEQDTQTEVGEEFVPHEMVPTNKTIPELMQYIVHYLNWYFVNDAKKENAITVRHVERLVMQYNLKQSRTLKLADSDVPIEFFTQQKKSDGRSRGMGLCRHQSLLAAFLIVMLMRHVQKHAASDAEPIKFQAYLVSENIERVAENKEEKSSHAVAVCKMEDMIYILDPGNNKLVSVQQGKIISEIEDRFKSYHYKKFIESIVKRYYIEKSVKQDLTDSSKYQSFAAKQSCQTH